MHCWTVCLCSLSAVTCFCVVESNAVRSVNVDFITSLLHLHSEWHTLDTKHKNLTLRKLILIALKNFINTSKSVTFVTILTDGGNKKQNMISNKTKAWQGDILKVFVLYNLVIGLSSCMNDVTAKMHIFFTFSKCYQLHRKVGLKVMHHINWCKKIIDINIHIWTILIDVIIVINIHIWTILNIWTIYRYAPY